MWDDYAARKKNGGSLMALIVGDCVVIYVVPAAPSSDSHQKANFDTSLVQQKRTELRFGENTLQRYKYLVAAWGVLEVLEEAVHGMQSDGNRCTGRVGTSRVGEVSIATNPKVVESMNPRLGVGDRRGWVVSDTSGTLQHVRIQSNNLRLSYSGV